MPKFFVDTSVVLHALKNDEGCKAFLSHAPAERIASFDVVKELYRTLGGSGAMAQEAVDFLRGNCGIVARIDPRRAYAYVLRDKSDLLILAGAIREKCDYLVSEDFKLREDAKKYIKAVTAREALQLLRGNDKKQVQPRKHI